MEEDPNEPIKTITLNNSFSKDQTGFQILLNIISDFLPQSQIQKAIPQLTFSQSTINEYYSIQQLKALFKPLLLFLSSKEEQRVAHKHNTQSIVQKIYEQKSQILQGQGFEIQMLKKILVDIEGIQKHQNEVKYSFSKFFPLREQEEEKKDLQNDAKLEYKSYELKINRNNKKLVRNLLLRFKQLSLLKNLEQIGVGFTQYTCQLCKQQYSPEEVDEFISPVCKHSFDIYCFKNLLFSYPHLFYQNQASYPSIPCPKIGCHCFISVKKFFNDSQRTENQRKLSAVKN